MSSDSGGRTPLAKKSKLTRVAAKVGGMLGKADRKAHKVVEAGALAKQELEAIAKQVGILKRELEKAARRLKHADQVRPKSLGEIQEAFEIQVRKFVSPLVLQALQTPGATEQLSESDPLTSAKLRGAVRQHELVNKF